MQSHMQSVISRVGAALTAVGLVVVLAMVAWAPARQDVPDPPPDASAQQVVASYLAAVNARDFATANRLTLAHFLQYGRLESAPKFARVQVGDPRSDGDVAGTTDGTGFAESVFVPVTFEQSDQPTQSGYRLVRQTAGSPWLIIG